MVSFEHPIDCNIQGETDWCFLHIVSQLGQLYQIYTCTAPEHPNQSEANKVSNSNQQNFLHALTTCVMPAYCDIALYFTTSGCRATTTTATATTSATTVPERRAGVAATAAAAGATGSSPAPSAGSSAPSCWPSSSLAL